jgi:hypothetical protein
VFGSLQELVPVGGHYLVQGGLLGPVALILALRTITAVLGMGGVSHD